MEIWGRMSCSRCGEVLAVRALIERTGDHELVPEAVGSQDHELRYFQLFVICPGTFKVEVAMSRKKRWFGVGTSVRACNNHQEQGFWEWIRPPCGQSSKFSVLHEMRMEG